MDHTEEQAARVPQTDGPPPDDGIERRYLPDATETEVYRQAWWAYVLGSPGNCPYAEGTYQREWWDESWAAAEQDDCG